MSELGLKLAALVASTEPLAIRRPSIIAKAHTRACKQNVYGTKYAQRTNEEPKKNARLGRTPCNLGQEIVLNGDRNLARLRITYIGQGCPRLVSQ